MSNVDQLELEGDLPEKTVEVGRRLYVNNLSWRVSWQDLKDLFGTAGAVVFADVMKRDDGKSKGWGIVEYENSQDAAQALSMFNETDMQGRKIYVREDRDDYELKRSGNNPVNDGNPRPVNEAKRSFNPRPNVRSNANAAGNNRVQNANAAGNKRVQNVGSVTGRGVYVSSLHPSTSWQDLKDLFRSVGEVQRADVFPSSRGDRSYGIIEYTTVEAAQECINTMDRSMLHGQPVFVREDRQEGKKDRQDSEPKFESGGSGSSQVQSQNQSQVVVFGLPFAYKWQDLKELFQQDFHIVRADVAVAPNGRPKGIGTVLFKDATDAQAAIERWDKQELEGRYLSVKLDKFAK